MTNLAIPERKRVSGWKSLLLLLCAEDAAALTLAPHRRAVSRRSIRKVRYLEFQTELTKRRTDTAAQAELANTKS